ncbi:hypothetical protein CYLTODRAFT_424236 [Cylindrobasidium torrendii FP15055 ss-10]|uniref:HTH APSES-type domain-containing protein n=1 Tax=Cylindrobasidium torrendii FP15055 ss-10 TaxID=1314674 RepID=A0A0D7B4R3_9AGAR|nr:hypothetical protein CYLTODRAFT_424236 [Cylindrobasidium torrendii FP15055 ss-10]
MQEHQDAAHSSSEPARFQPYASSKHRVTKARYITSNDPRGYLPVYEYPLNNQWIMLDVDDGFVLWTGIWKALGHNKADIVKMVDAQPELQNRIRRVRGGYLKIQGTWMPYEVALRLARRVAWDIREDLVPLFGPTFPSTCLTPDQPGYGQLVPSARRRVRRTVPASSERGGLAISTDAPFSAGQTPHNNPYPKPQSDLPIGDPSVHGAGRQVTRTPPTVHRYAPYPVRSPTDYSTYTMEPSRPSSITSTSAGSDFSQRTSSHYEQSSRSLISSPSSAVSLPPFSSLENLRGVEVDDTAAVLQRLRSDDRCAHNAHPDQRFSHSPPLYHYGSISSQEHRKLPFQLSIPTTSSSGSSSSSAASPISPATPEADTHHLSSKFNAMGLVPLHILEQTRGDYDIRRRHEFGHGPLDEHIPVRPW